MKNWCRDNWLGVAGFALAVLTWSACAQTVSLDLKSGDRVTGQIISESTNRIVLSNAWARELIIPLADISRRTPPVSASNIVITSAATNTPAKTAVTATNSFFASPAFKNWHGETLVGTDLTFSQRNRQVYNAKAKLTYAKDRFKSVFDYDATYGRSQVDETVVVNGQVTARQIQKTDANRMNGALKTDYDLTKQWYLYNLGGAGYDEVRKITLRYEIGPGLGHRLIVRTNFLVNAEVGANYQNEERADGTELSKFFYRLAENAAWKITPRLSWDEKMEYTPRVEDVGEFRFRFESNLRYALVQNVFFNLSLIDTYDSLPASGVTQNDLQLRSSVGMKF